jgi:hypothetical protein
MDFISFRYEIIEDRYVLVSVLKNMQLIAELRFYPDGNHVRLKDINFVHCTDDDLAEKIFDRANKLAKKNKLI